MSTFTHKQIKLFPWSINKSTTVPVNCDNSKINDIKTSIKTGYTNEGCAYLYNKDSRSTDTIIWIPGGGLASILFAYSGVGPYIIKEDSLYILEKSSSIQFRFKIS